jgi:hypothetical protein
MAKKTKLTGRKKKTKFGRSMGILLFVVAMIAIVTLSVFLQTTKKERADIYFEFSEVSAIATEDGNNIFVGYIWFNFTPVKGNARDLILRPPGMVTEGDAPYFDEVLKGEWEKVEVTLVETLHFTKDNDNSYPVRFTVSCVEAEGEVYVYITNLTIV